MQPSATPATLRAIGSRLHLLGAAQTIGGFESILLSGRRVYLLMSSMTCGIGEIRATTRTPSGISPAWLAIQSAGLKASSGDFPDQCPLGSQGRRLEAAASEIACGVPRALLGRWARPLSVEKRTELPYYYPSRYCDTNI